MVTPVVNRGADRTPPSHTSLMMLINQAASLSVCMTLPPSQCGVMLCSSGVEVHSQLPHSFTAGFDVWRAGKAATFNEVRLIADSFPFFYLLYLFFGEVGMEALIIYRF